MSHRNRLRWALVAATGTCCFVFVALASSRSAAGVRIDLAVRDWLLNRPPEAVRLAMDHLARPLIIVVLAPIVVLLALLAVVRRGWRRAVAGLFVPAAATALALKVPGRQILGIDLGGFPSHHAVAGLALLVGVAVVWPRPVTRRGLVALAAAGLVVCLGNVTGYAHQPRDVLGSVMLVLAVSAAAFAVLGGNSPNLAAQVRPPGGTARPPGGWV